MNQLIEFSSELVNIQYVAVAFLVSVRFDALLCVYIKRYGSLCKVFGPGIPKAVSIHRGITPLHYVEIIIMPQSRSITWCTLLVLTLVNILFAVVAVHSVVGFVCEVLGFFCHNDVNPGNVYLSNSWLRAAPLPCR